MLSGLRYSVFGLGNSLYGEHYNSVGKNLFHWLGQLSGTAVYPLGEGDQNVAQSKNGGLSKNWLVIFNFGCLGELGNVSYHKDVQLFKN